METNKIEVDSVNKLSMKEKKLKANTIAGLLLGLVYIILNILRYPVNHRYMDALIKTKVLDKIELETIFASSDCKMSEILLILQGLAGITAIILFLFSKKKRVFFVIGLISALIYIVIGLIQYPMSKTFIVLTKSATDLKELSVILNYPAYKISTFLINFNVYIAIVAIISFLISFIIWIRNRSSRK
jgi:hypothetical protein